jgi:hypothetical protein
VFGSGKAVMVQAQAVQLFSEIFPLSAAALPTLYAYRPVYDGEAVRGGARLAARLSQQLGGRWLWLHGRLLTDQQPHIAKLLLALDALRGQHPQMYAALTAIEEDLSWRASPDDAAEFAVRGALAELTPFFVDALARSAPALKNARVVIEPRLRAWVVDGQPSVAINVQTHIVYALDVIAYAQTLPQPETLIGLEAADKTSTLQGTIIKLLGTLDRQRERLYDLAKSADMRDLIAAAPDDSPVLRVEARGELYDYAAAALDLLVTTETAARFDVVPGQIARALEAGADACALRIKAIADQAKQAGLIGDAYSQRSAPTLFEQLAPRLSVVWGGDKARDYEPAQLGAQFAQFGLARRPDRFDTGPLRIVVLNALGEDADIFLEALRRDLERLHAVTIEIARERKVKVDSPENVEAAMRALVKEQADVLIAFVGDDPADARRRQIKMQAVERAWPSLVLDLKTINDVEAMPLLIMGLLARAGGTPFMFEEPLPYADQIVGLALHRFARRGRAHLSALVRVFSNRGVCLGWRAVQTSGEALTESDWVHLLPPREIAARRILIHIDGRLSDLNAAALTAWEEAHDAAFYPVEIVPRSAPRLYAFVNKRIESAPRGALMRLSPRDALLATVPPGRGAMPYPLSVHGLTQQRIDPALESIMALLTLHHGARHTPTLPVTTAHAETWAEAVERGIFPNVAGGDTAWWL